MSSTTRPSAIGPIITVPGLNRMSTAAIKPSPSRIGVRLGIIENSAKPGERSSKPMITTITAKAINMLRFWLRKR